MKITYTLTPENMKEAGAIAYRTKVLPKKLIILGALYALLLYTLEAVDDLFTALFLLVIFALLLLLNRFLYMRRCATAPFKGKASTIPHTLEVDEEKLQATTPTTNSEVQWSHFLTLTERPNGVLIYPQKNIFFFIPSNAEIDGGSWEELTSLLRTKIAS